MPDSDRAAASGRALTLKERRAATLADARRELRRIRHAGDLPRGQNVGERQQQLLVYHLQSCPDHIFVKWEAAGGKYNAVGKYNFPDDPSESYDDDSSDDDDDAAPDPSFSPGSKGAKKRRNKRRAAKRKDTSADDGDGPGKSSTKPKAKGKSKGKSNTKSSRKSTKKKDSKTNKNPSNKQTGNKKKKPASGKESPDAADSAAAPPAAADPVVRSHDRPADNVSLQVQILPMSADFARSAFFT